VAETDSHYSGADPGVVLGVSEDADKEDIRRAYLNQIRAYPPDRHPEMFEKIRDAYELLLDPRKRTALFLRSIDPEASFVSLLEGSVQKRRRVGPEPWLSLMKRDT